MAKRTTDASTVEVPGKRERTTKAEDRTLGLIPALTILCHPDLSRVGQRALLPEIVLGRDALVSRGHPEFAAPGRTQGTPLAVRHLSRRPLCLRSGAGGGVVLALGESRTQVKLGNGPLAGERLFAPDEIARGVVLELAERVVLLLHFVATAPPGPPPPDYGLVGASDGLIRVRWDIGRVADLNVPVLLRGQTGTGKELVARAIHDAGPRRRGPFVAVNLGAIAPTLVASELFGAVRGAYTGAVQSQEGYFRRAHGGTLLLDEVGEATAELQVMLLRALETGEIHPVGSQGMVKVEVRLLAATDADLEARVRQGSFRAPLLHRLAGYEIALPPLADRRDDVARLLVAFLAEELAALGEADRLREPAGGEPWLPASLVARLARYDWPGNVRQLKNVARQLAIGSRGAERLAVNASVERILAEDAHPAGRSVHPATDAPARRRPSEIDEDELASALRANRWDLQATAKALRISRPSLYALIESSPRVRKAGDLSADEIARCLTDCAGDLDRMVERLEVSKKALRRRLRELRLA